MSMSLFDFFVPATNKLEAVNRISNLTNSGRELLGPGSKERKSVVINLAAGLGVPFSAKQTKQEIASNIAARLGVAWTRECQSAGQTLTLEGLNLLLESAEPFLSRFHQRRKPGLRRKDFQDELLEIAPVARRSSPKFMDGETCVREMKEMGHSQWRQAEWQGFYVEMKVRNALVSKLGGGPAKVGSTSFDYVRNHVWDIKVHSIHQRTGARNPGCQLNDKDSFRTAAKESGVGLIILSGESIRDSKFAEWHRQYRGQPAKEGGRPLVSRFASESLDFFFFKDEDEIRRAETTNVLKHFAQGRQQSGEPRNPKFVLDTRIAMDSEFHRLTYKF
jgi:hypothetical protein